MARGSAGEVRSHLYVARDLDYITETEFERMASRVIGLSKGVFRFIQHLESSEANAK
ncbi:MAG TPA: four helix bundle protein [Nitrospiraceae bacterium]